MFVTRPMMATSACATKPVAIARTTAHAEMTTTRLSSVDRSMGTRAASNVGASDGATGTPSVDAPPSKSGSTNLLFPPRRHSFFLFFEKQRRAFLRADGVEDRVERFGELSALARGELLDCGEQIFLGDGRRFAQRGAAGARQRENETARVVRRAVAREEPLVHETRDDCGCGALIGMRPLRQFAEGDLRRASDLRKDEKLRGGDADTLLRGAVGDPQLPNQSPHRIKYSLRIRHRAEQYIWGPK